ncbi:MAG: crosslink repair DNA glycosylase YcaQ family protein [Devosia sp.]|nr:crosslink repair DNA glycosylase YcaQ family protein [Devosia sp.]
MPVRKPVPLSTSRARQIWLHAQRLDVPSPFGDGAPAALAAIEHLGYVQIDTINVIERCHHHILFTRIPGYRRAHLQRAQTVDKTVFEYWTHALAYVPVRDFRFFVPEMQRHRKEPHRWFARNGEMEYRRVLRLIRDQGPLSIRDIDDDVLVEKDHPWASRKPSKAALQLGFYNGVLTIGERSGMLKTYELTTRHYGWDKLPRPATKKQVLSYMLDRALRAQGIVSLDSIQHTHARFRPELKALIEARVKQKTLLPVVLEGAGKLAHWAKPEAMDVAAEPEHELVHILSPFDPLIIQRKRLSLFFGYDHLFEAYVPKNKRKLGYFALPVLVGDEIVAALDLKTDRAAGKLLIRSWTWVGSGNAAAHQAAIEEELGRFERFQLAE